jgi:hypothetical protein
MMNPAQILIFRLRIEISRWPSLAEVLENLRLLVEEKHVVDKH